MSPDILILFTPPILLMVIILVHYVKSCHRWRLRRFVLFPSEYRVLTPVYIRKTQDFIDMSPDKGRNGEAMPPSRGRNYPVGLDNSASAFMGSILRSSVRRYRNIQCDKTQNLHLSPQVALLDIVWLCYRSQEAQDIQLHATLFSVSVMASLFSTLIH